MTHDMTAAMRRATELVRGGDPAAATALIQSALNGTAAPAPKAEPRRLGALLKARRPGAEPALARPLPDGARFAAGTFACGAGQRDYRVFVPDLGGAPAAGLVMMLHGCTQSPVDFANGTDMNRIAAAHRLVVVYPAQARGANMQSCWNWFSPTDQLRDTGEPAILAGLAQKMQQEHGVPAGRVYVAGLSAGAAMAVILGQTYPEVFAAVGAHSGLPYRAAHDVGSAFAAMRQTDPARGTAQVRQVPTIVFHGLADATVHPANGARIAAEAGISGAEVEDRGGSGARTWTRTTVLAEGGAALEHWRVAGLGHAWSGGQSSGTYADPAGPDASAEMVRFFLDLPAKGH